MPSLPLEALKNLAKLSSLETKGVILEQHFEVIQKHATEGRVPQERGRVFPGERMRGPEFLHGMGSEVLPQKLDAREEPATPGEVDTFDGQLARADDVCVQGVSIEAFQLARLFFSGQYHGRAAARGCRGRTHAEG